jgi:hypothetical protein
MKNKFINGDWEFNKFSINSHKWSNTDDIKVGKMVDIKIVTSWQALFKYAHEEGQARLKYKDFPSEKNKELLDEAIKNHNEYRDLCLQADEMIGLEGII